MNRLAQVIAGTSAAVVLSPFLSSCGSEQAAGPSIIDTERRAIAGRIAACSIIDSLQAPGIPEYVADQLGDPDPGDRHTIIFSLKTDQTPDAIAAVKKYDQDDIIIWKPTDIIASVVKHDTTRKAVGQEEVDGRVEPKGATGFESSSTREVKLYPETGFVAGDTISIDTKTTAISYEDNKQRNTVATRHCGGFILALTADKTELTWTAIPQVDGVAASTLQESQGTLIN